MAIVVTKPVGTLPDETRLQAIERELAVAKKLSEYLTELAGLAALREKDLRAEKINLLAGREGGGEKDEAVV